jgi:hypothetical protein
LLQSATDTLVRLANDLDGGDLMGLLFLEFSHCTQGGYTEVVGATE